MRVDWSAQARSDLVSIFEHISADNPRAARAVVKQLRATTGLVERHPFAGRVVPEFEVAHIRERILPPYRVVYRVESERVLVLTVMHSRRLLRDLLD